MLNSIQSALNSVVSTGRIAKSNPSDIYEAYIFSLVVEAAREEGASVEFVNRDGTVSKTLIFRTSPGYVYSKAKNYSYARISFANRPVLEAHVGIRITGKSGVLHEGDVSVIESAEAENCRNNNLSPRSSKVLILVECKFYSSHLQLHLARSFVGLVGDMSVKEPFFVSNTSSFSVDKLLSHRVRNWEKDIKPTCKNREEERLIFSFRNAYKNYVSR